VTRSLTTLRLCAAFVALATCAWPQPSAAAPTASDAVAPAAAEVEPAELNIDPLPDLEAFVDGITANLAHQRIAGVQIAIVKDGQPRLIKGYGMSALAQ
jgi:CubicO group peptidase (beta-lactamase class C family)